MTADLMFLMELARTAADSAGVDDMTPTFAELSHLVVISASLLLNFLFMLHLTSFVSIYPLPYPVIIIWCNVILEMDSNVCVCFEEKMTGFRLCIHRSK